MLKFFKRKARSERKEYLKYGFVKTEFTSFSCPRCGGLLNAGPNHKPKYCSNCGQRITFDGVAWEEPKELGYVMDDGTLMEWGAKIEQVEN